MSPVCKTGPSTLQPLLKKRRATFCLPEGHSSLPLVLLVFIHLQALLQFSRPAMFFFCFFFFLVSTSCFVLQLYHFTQFSTSAICSFLSPDCLSHVSQHCSLLVFSSSNSATQVSLCCCFLVLVEFFFLQLSLISLPHLVSLGQWNEVNHCFKVKMTALH